GATFFRQVSVEGTVPVESTEIVGTKATGTVQIVNRTTQEQKIRDRSRLMTKEGVLFYMTRHVIVAPDSRASVEVEAAEAGEVGNIAPQRLNFAALDASAQSVVYAEATAAISGGKGEEVRVVREEDIERARIAAKEAARAKVQEEIQKELPSGWVLLEESWTADYDSFKTDGEVGSRQPQIAYSGNATVRVLGYESARLEERLRAALEERIDQDYALFPGPISYSKTVKSVDWEKGEGVIATRVTHTTIPDFSLETLKGKIARRGADEAKTYLEGLPGVQRVELAFSPFWVRSIPRIEKRINLEVIPERQP
ncbi:MAG: baseplate J/gp47 family protein, partial [Patescibacteria group bacterium]